jgi:hypothetical protein
LTSNKKEQKKESLSFPTAVRSFSLRHAHQVLAHLEKESPQQHPFFHGQIGKYLFLEPLPGLLYIPLQSPSCLCQVDARDALVLCIVLAFHQARLFHPLDRRGNGGRPDVRLLGQFRVRQPILPPQAAQDSMLPPVQAEFLQQFVRSGVLEPADLGEQRANGF